MKKPAIICIDDEVTILDSLKIQLKKAVGSDYLIETALGGEDALELVDELLEDEYEIALVISDYIMPDIKGDEVLKQIHELSPKTLKIMLTGQADLEAVGNAIKYAKLYRYIAKPWRAEDLCLTVSEALNSYTQTKQLAQRNLQFQQMNEALEEANREQSQLIAQLQENEYRLQQLLDGVPVGMMVLDGQGQLYYLNSRAKQILSLGMVPATIQSLSEQYQFYKVGTEELYPPEQLPIVRALAGENTQVDDLEIRQQDQKIPLEVWGMPVYNAQGQIAYAIAAFQDISDRQKTEAELQQFIEDTFEGNISLELAIDSQAQLTEATGRFVPSQFLQVLNKKSIVEVELGESVAQEMSIMFADIRSFTTLSEQMSLEDNFKFINAYLSRMEPAIIENNGFIDKYIGDAIMALFRGSADNAIDAAISMLQRLADYNTTRQRPDRPPINIGIGVNTGNLMLGTVGGQSRMDSTAISDSVNLASRLEELTKTYSAPLLISHHTLSRLQDPMKYALRLVDRVQIKGKSERVSVFEVFDAEPSEEREAKLATKPLFEMALLRYYVGAFEEATELLQRCLQDNQSDRVAQIYLARCQTQQRGKPVQLLSSL